MNIFRLRLLINFYTQLTSMVNSGMGIISCIDILAKHGGNHKIMLISKQIKESLAKGNSLSMAMSQCGYFFPQWHIDIIKCSEASGKIGQGLQRITDYLEKDCDVQKNIIIGLAYPTLLLHIAIFALPIASLVSGGFKCYMAGVLKVFLPLYFFIFIIVFLKKLLFGAGFKKIYDGFILIIPIFGNLTKKFILAGFIRTLQCLYSSGVDIITSWNLATKTCDNQLMSNYFSRGLPVIEKGGLIQEAFIQTEVFPPKTISMITVGEQSASIDKMLDKIALYYEKENELTVGVLVKIIPVFVYLAVAGYIGYQVVAFYNNYFSKIFSY